MESFCLIGVCRTFAVISSVFATAIAACRRLISDLRAVIGQMIRATLHAHSVLVTFSGRVHEILTREALGWSECLICLSVYSKIELGVVIEYFLISRSDGQYHHKHGYITSLFDELSDECCKITVFPIKSYNFNVCYVECWGG